MATDYRTCGQCRRPFFVNTDYIAQLKAEGRSEDADRCHPCRRLARLRATHGDRVPGVVKFIARGRLFGRVQLTDRTTAYFQPGLDDDLGDGLVPGLRVTARLEAGHPHVRARDIRVAES